MARTSLALRAYVCASRAIPLLAGTLLRRRLARGKEDPARYGEKLGRASLPRPQGRLVWLNAVGLGEVLALRSLIAAMSRLDPDLHFLVTSSTRTSAQVLARNMPARTQHQFLPLDAPGYLARFLDHWRPDLSVWAEQEIWPGAVLAADRRGIPLAMVNARITAQGYARRARLRRLFADLLGRMRYVSAQDVRSANRLGALGATNVHTGGSLKPAAPDLGADPADLALLTTALQGRRIWVAASTHPGDEAEALAAQARLFAMNPDWLLILVPRDVTRSDDLAQGLQAAGAPFCRRSAGQVPTAGQAIWLADSYGELGLWYRLAKAALIGGGFDDIGGHNPWEAAQLGASILYGPDTYNFSADYALLADADAAVMVGPAELVQALQSPELANRAARAAALAHDAKAGVDAMAAALLHVMGPQQ